MLFLKHETRENAMQLRLISHLVAQLARLLGLVKRVRPVQMGRGKKWGVLVEGRGFTRLLEQELLDAPGLHRPHSWASPRPVAFGSRRAAEHYARAVGLIRATGWQMAEDS